VGWVLNCLAELLSEDATSRNWYWYVQRIDELFRIRMLGGHPANLFGISSEAAAESVLSMSCFDKAELRAAVAG
jgi:hypothetical protein